MAFGAREFGGYVLSPLRLASYDAIHQLTLHHPQALPHFNVRWQITDNQDRSFRTTQLPNPTALAQIYYAASVLRPQAMLDRFRDPTPITTAMLEDFPSPYRASVTPRPPSTANLEKFTTNRIQLRVQVRDHGILVLNEMYYPGWTAHIDGKSVPVFKANYFMRAIAVPPGDHTVVFDYRPSYQLWLLLSWFAGWGLVLWLAFLQVQPAIWAKVSRIRHHPALTPS